jgi:hypothetical protein
MLYRILGAVTIFAFGCATAGNGARSMSGHSNVPAAQGEVRVAEEENGNTQLNLRVKHLAKPGAVDPNASTYVVWVQDTTDQGNIQNLGALRIGDDLSGEFEAVTPLRQFEVFVTAEPVATAQSPTGDRALWTTVSM